MNAFRMVRWLVLPAVLLPCLSCQDRGQKQPAAAPAEKKDQGQSEKPAGGKPVVVIDTSMGQIKVELYPDKAPRTVENFLKYVDDRHYDYMIFHRVKGDFMIQGGGFAPDLKEKPVRPPIPNEAANGLKNQPGTIAMARTGDPNSATSQFFINTANNDKLDFRSPDPEGIGYAVFGKVIEGMDVVHKIANVETETPGPEWQWRPKQAVIIRSIRRAGS